MAEHKLTAVQIDVLMQDNPYLKSDTERLEVNAQLLQQALTDFYARHDDDTPITDADVQAMADTIEQLADETPTPDYEQFAENARILQDLQRAAQALEAQAQALESHQHMFMFALNANHTVIRGCMHCGETCVSLAMGNPADLLWHRIQEPE